MINIAIIDFHPVVLEGLTILLKRNPQFDVVAGGSTAQEILDISTNFSPDVFIIEILTSDDIIDKLNYLKSIKAGIITLIFTASVEIKDALRSLDAGARAYVLKTEKFETLETAIYASLRGEIYIAGAIALKVITALQQKVQVTASLTATNLTKRERHVLRLLVQGRKNIDIADELGIAESTIKGHMNKIMTKLKAKNRLEAVIMAQKLDI